MGDPLSGLVTGRHYDAESVRVRVVEPSMPDIVAVREAMASVLDEDSEIYLGERTYAEQAAKFRAANAPATADAPAPAAAAPPATAPPTAAAPAAAPPATAPATLPAAPPVMPRLIAPPLPPSALPPVVETGQRSRIPARFEGGPLGLLPGRIPTQRGDRPRRPARARRRGWSPGMAAIGLLLLVIGVLVIVMLANFIETITSLFS
jgi:biotin carboxyl carrier protein